MNLKNSITLTAIQSGSDRTKFLIPIEAIINVFEVLESQFGSNAPKIKTIVLLSLENYKKLGLQILHDRYTSPTLNGEMTIPVEEEFKVLTSLLKDTKASKILLE